MSLIIQFPIRPDQDEFNLKRWNEVLADPHYVGLDGTFDVTMDGAFLEFISQPIARWITSVVVEQKLLATPLEIGYARLRSPQRFHHRLALNNALVDRVVGEQAV